MNQKVMLLLGLAVPLFAVACNSNPVVVPTQEDTPLLMQQDPESKGSQVDLLWMIDDSGSMAEEQGGIIEELGLLASKLRSVDFQVAVTSTDDVGGGSRSFNCPNADVSNADSGKWISCAPGEFRNRASIELNDVGTYSVSSIRKIIGAAVENCLVPGHSSDALDEFEKKVTAYSLQCYDGSSTTEVTGEAGMDKVLAGKCLPTSSSEVEPKKVLIAELNKLLPQRDQLREVGPVLKASDYRSPTSEPNEPLSQPEFEKLQKDLTCLTLVGTQGSGIEKGIGAVIEAVKKGGVNKKNPLIRPNAKTVLTLVSDENDCTHRKVTSGQHKNKDLDESICVVVACNFFNTIDLGFSSAQNPLVAPETLAQDFITELKNAKGNPATFDAKDVSAVAITGTALPQPRQTLPGFTKQAADKAKDAATKLGKRVPVVNCSGSNECTITNGTIPDKVDGKKLSGSKIPGFLWSGGGALDAKYCETEHDSGTGAIGIKSTSALQLEQAACYSTTFGSSVSGDRYYRFIESLGGPYFPNKRGDLGLMCYTDFSAVFKQLGEMVGGEDGDCIKQKLVPCEGGQTTCGPAGAEGVCIPYPEKSRGSFCSASVQPSIICNDDAQLKQVKDLCVEGSVEGKSCILNPKNNYNLKNSCTDQKNVKFTLETPAKTKIKSAGCSVLLNFTAFAGSSTDKKEESK